MRSMATTYEMFSVYRQDGYSSAAKYQQFEKRLEGELLSLSQAENVEPGLVNIPHRLKIRPAKAESIVSVLSVGNSMEPMGFVNLIHLPNLSPKHWFATFTTRTYIRPEFRGKHLVRPMLERAYHLAQYIHEDWQPSPRKPTLIIESIVIPESEELKAVTVGIRHILYALGGKEVSPKDPNFIVKLFTTK